MAATSTPGEQKEGKILDEDAVTMCMLNAIAYDIRHRWHTGASDRLSAMNDLVPRIRNAALRTKAEAAVSDAHRSWYEDNDGRSVRSAWEYGTGMSIKPAHISEIGSANARHLRVECGASKDAVSYRHPAADFHCALHLVARERARKALPSKLARKVARKRAARVRRCTPLPPVLVQIVSLYDSVAV
jgi:hypothetical protein